MLRFLSDQYLAVAIVVVAVLIPNWTEAGTGREIKHLLHYIENSGCTFVRNGKEYNSTQARAHIERKYNYAKRWIKTAEEFIKYAASKSSTTGEPYKVRCDRQEMLTSEWLAAELDRFRQQ